MAKWIKETFEVEIPDYPFSLKRERKLVQEWTYEGPDKIICLVWKHDNILDPSYGYWDIPDDEEERKQMMRQLEILAGVPMYPAVISFEKDPLLLAMLRQGRTEGEEQYFNKYVTHQKEYYWDGTEEIHPFSDDQYLVSLDEDGEIDGGTIVKARPWMYAVTWPMRPDLIIEPGQFLYDPEKEEIVKPYPKRKPQITTQEFLYLYYKMIDSINKFIDTDGVGMPPHKLEPYLKYREELIALQEKAKNYWDKPWMISFPQDPRMPKDDFYKLETFQVYAGPGQKLQVTKDVLEEAAEEVKMEIPPHLR